MKNLNFIKESAFNSKGAFLLFFIIQIFFLFSTGTQASGPIISNQNKINLEGKEINLFESQDTIRINNAVQKELKKLHIQSCNLKFALIDNGSIMVFIDKKEDKDLNENKIKEKVEKQNIKNFKSVFSVKTNQEDETFIKKFKKIYTENVKHNNNNNNLTLTFFGSGRNPYKEFITIDEILNNLENYSSKENIEQKILNIHLIDTSYEYFLESTFYKKDTKEIFKSLFNEKELINILVYFYFIYNKSNELNIIPRLFIHHNVKNCLICSKIFNLKKSNVLCAWYPPTFKNAEQDLLNILTNFTEENCIFFRKGTFEIEPQIFNSKIKNAYTTKVEYRINNPYRENLVFGPKDKFAE